MGDSAGNGLGGGLYVAGGDAHLELVEVTLNLALGGAGGKGGMGVGGGVYIASGQVCARLTRIADNFASTSDDDVFGVIVPC